MRTPTGNSRLALSTDLTTGEQLGGYRILERRGLSTADVDSRGFSMAAVLYEAEEISTGRTVLLKVFKRRLTREDAFAKRFMREGKRVASFAHPNIAAVHRVGLRRDRLYLVAEQVGGETLANRLQAGGLSAAQTIALLAPIADALDAAHDAGLVHGDVRPDTIRIDAEGVPRLAAFRVLKLPARINVAGVESGNVDYASPEQLCDQPLSAATDVYSLTAVLYHCLTGELPFSEDAPAEEIDFEYVPSLSWFEPPCSQLDAVIARGMASNPEHRYEYARELIEEATEALDELPLELLESTPTFLPVRREDGSHRRGRARGTRIALAGALVVAAVAGVLGASGLKGPSGANLRAAGGGALTLNYGRGWEIASAPVTGEFALSPASGTASPVALRSRSVTVTAGSLRESAALPGGLPPQLAARFGRPAFSAPALVAEHPARLYGWTLPAGATVIALVLPSTGSDLALVCSGADTGRGVVSACETLANEAGVAGVTVIPPGPDGRLASTLRRDLAPLAGTLDELRGLGGSLPARSLLAATAARAERVAWSELARATPPARNADALADLRSALASEHAAFVNLAAAAGAEDRGAYADARLQVLVAQRLVAAAEATLVQEGFAPPPLAFLSLDGAPPAPPHHPASGGAESSNPPVAGGAGSDSNPPSTGSTPSGSTSTSSRSSYSPPSSPSSSPAIVVVPTGSSGSPAGSGQSVVVVPTG